MQALHHRPAGFTLVEMMVGIAISAILIGATLVVMSQVNSTVRHVDSKMDAFQSAQAGFDLMTQKLSDATLNTYYDYLLDSNNNPTAYLRRSDLHFLIEQNYNLTASVFPNAQGTAAANANSGQSVFFQVPAGYSNSSTFANTPGLLNSCAYFIQFGPNNAFWPSILTTPPLATHYRYRLMQAIQPTEANSIYGDLETTSPEGGSMATAFPATTWFQSLGATALPIADNVIALIIWPQSPAVTDAAGNSVNITTDYQYSSRQGFPLATTAAAIQKYQAEQLPQILQLTLVAIDAASAMHLDTGSANPPAVIENALKGTGTGLFRTATTAQYAADLASLETSLTAAHVNYQVLTTSVTLRESKWSNGQ